MQKKVFRKVCNIVLDILIVICGLVLLISIYNDLQVKVFKKSHADFFGYSTFEVQTGSMVPAINVSDLIIVKKDNSPKVKDIITYEKDGTFITHRVVEAYKETYVTKGDANNTKDEAITQDQIVGKVVKVIPHFGIIRKTILNPFVLVALIITVYIMGLLFGKKENKNSLDKFITKLFSKKPKKVELEKTVAVKVVSQTTDEDVSVAKEVLANIDTEEDLDKTIYFRKVSVDSSELNQKVPKIVEKEEVKEEVVIEEVDAPSKVEALKKRKKKFENLIDKVMFIKEEEINELVNVLNQDKVKSNEATIKEELLKYYIDGKYYNHCGDINVEYNSKNECSKLEEVLNNVSLKMIKDYKGTDAKYEQKVLKYAYIFMLITNIEHINKLYEDTDIKISAYQKKLSKYIDSSVLNSVIGKIISIQKTYAKILDDALEPVTTNTFELEYNQLTTKKNMYGLVLKHNISFSKIYSDYIIDKTYDEGIVAEDKVLVIINMLYNKIAYNMLNNNLKTNYILYLPASLYEKEVKLNRVLKLLQDEACKNSVLLLVRYSVLIKNKKIIKDIKKLGYRFAIYFDDTSIKEKDKTVLSVADYVFASRKIIQTLDMTLYISKDSIIVEDVTSKVDISGGE